MAVGWRNEKQPDRLWEPPPRNLFDRLLESGRYKPVESDNPIGPWTDCTCLDNGDVVVTKRYQRIVRKGGGE